MSQCRIFVAICWRYISRSVMRFWKFQASDYFSHLYCVLMIQLSLKEPSWWVDVFWASQQLFSACLFYFLVCTCVVHKRCHHLIVTACTCQNNTNKTDLKVKSWWLFWVIKICESWGFLGCWGLSYNRIYSVLSLFIDFKVKKSDRDMHKGYAISSGCSSVNSSDWLD